MDVTLLVLSAVTIEISASPALEGVNMKCGEVRKFLSSYIDDALDIATTRIVSKHLKRCDECNRRFDELRALSAYISKTNIIERDLALELRLFNAVKIAQSNPTLLERMVRAYKIDWRTVTAVGAIVVALAVFITGGQNAFVNYANTYASVGSKVVSDEVESSKTFWDNVVKESCEQISNVSRKILGGKNEVEPTPDETANIHDSEFVALLPLYLCAV